MAEAHLTNEHNSMSEIVFVQCMCTVTECEHIYLNVLQLLKVHEKGCPSLFGVFVRCVAYVDYDDEYLLMHSLHIYCSVKFHADGTDKHRGSYSQ